MTTREDLDRKRLADRKTALLGLAADSNSEKHGSCLSSEEMGELLDHCCSPEQRHHFLTHLSTCDTCYREWLDLQACRETRAVPGKPLLFRRKVLPIAGSLLAAAASVVFYLNIDKGTVPDQVSTPTSPEADGMRGKSIQRADDALFEEPLTGLEYPVPLEVGAQDVDSVRVKREHVQEKKGVTAGSNGVESFSSVARPEAEQPPSPATAVDPASQWLQQVTEKCAGGGSEPEWRMLARAGRRLPAAEHFRHVLAVVDHVERIADGGNREIECRAIMNLLEERHGN